MSNVTYPYALSVNDPVFLSRTPTYVHGLDEYDLDALRAAAHVGRETCSDYLTKVEQSTATRSDTKVEQSSALTDAVRTCGTLFDTFIDNLMKLSKQSQIKPFLLTHCRKLNMDGGVRVYNLFSERVSNFYKEYSEDFVEEKRKELVEAENKNKEGVLTHEMIVIKQFLRTYDHLPVAQKMVALFANLQLASKTKKE